MSKCEHKSADVLADKVKGNYTFSVERCTWDCLEIYVHVKHPDGIYREELPAKVVGSFAKWEWQGETNAAYIGAA